jgi:hypothetical protein
LNKQNYANKEENSMPFKIDELVFSFKVSAAQQTEVQLKMEWMEGGQALDLKKAFDCGGRTSANPATALIEGQQALTELKNALGEVMKKLEELTTP